MFRDGEWSWYSIPEGKHQPLEFTEYVSRNFNFRSTVSPFYIHQAFEYNSFFFFFLIYLWQAMIYFLMGVCHGLCLLQWRSLWRENIMKLRSTLEFSSLDPSLFWVSFLWLWFCPLNWVDVIFILFCVAEKKNASQNLQRNSRLEEIGNLISWQDTFVLYWPFVSTNMYSYCDLPSY